MLGPLITPWGRVAPHKAHQHMSEVYPIDFSGFGATVWVTKVPKPWLKLWLVTRAWCGSGKL